MRTGIGPVPGGWGQIADMVDFHTVEFSILIHICHVFSMVEEKKDSAMSHVWCASFLKHNVLHYGSTSSAES